MTMQHPFSSFCRRTAALSLLLTLGLLAGGCTVYDNVLYGNRPGTVEQPGSAAEPGQPAIYIVASGDTVNDIANRFNVAPQTLIDRNSLKPPYTLHSGQWLEIPTEGGAIADRGVAPAAGGTVSGGAVQSTQLAPVSGAPSGGAVSSVAPATAAPASAAPQPTMPAPSSTQQATRVTPTSPPPAAAPAATPAATPAVARPSAALKFDWPVRGPILASFGQKPGGVQNDGIDIGAARGTPVKAAEAGTVLYAGEEVKGFGKLVLIGHADGYVTAYAHNEEVTVAKGRRVKKGEVIAKVGQTGNVGAPQLHFEIRQRNKAVDPVPLLGP